MNWKPVGNMYSLSECGRFFIIPGDRGYYIARQYADKDADRELAESEPTTLERAKAWCERQAAKELQHA